jgi:hypothetical protein
MWRNKTMQRFMILIACFGMMQGCTKQALYNTAQGARQNQCLKLAEDVAVARCLENANKRYDQYSQEQQLKQ